MNSPCFSRIKHSEFTKFKTPQIREPACESAFLWFGLPGRLLRVSEVIFALVRLFNRYFFKIVFKGSWEPCPEMIRGF